MKKPISSLFLAVFIVLSVSAGVKADDGHIPIGGVANPAPEITVQDQKKSRTIFSDLFDFIGDIFQK